VASAPAEPRLSRPGGIPPADAARLALLLACARNLGIGVSGTRGTSKTQLLRLIAWLDLQHGIPTIVLDPVGTLVDGLLSLIPYYRPEDQARLWRRIRYVDLTPTDHAVALPLLALLGVGRESAYDVAARFPVALGRLDPRLREASQEGFNVLWECALHGSAILFALGCGVGELPSLLREPEAWRGRLAAARARCPEVVDAVTFFERDYLPLKPEQRRAKTKALLTKLSLFADPPTKAQFAAPTPGLDWSELRAERQLWLFDLRHEPPGETRQFKLIWLLLLVIEYVKRWGAAHGGERGQPLSLIVDEVTALYAEGGASSRLLVADLDGLVNRYSRNYDVWVTLSYQELFQLPAGLRQTLLSLGTQFFGRMTDWETAEFIAKRYADFDPGLEKRREPILRTWQGQAYAIGERVETYSRGEQRGLVQDRLTRLPTFTYLASVTTAEGSPPHPLEECSIAPYAVRRFPRAARLEEVRAALTRRDGRPVAAILAEVGRHRPDELGALAAGHTPAGAASGVAESSVTEPPTAAPPFAVGPPPRLGSPREPVG